MVARLGNFSIDDDTAVINESCFGFLWRAILINGYISVNRFFLCRIDDWFAISIVFRQVFTKKDVSVLGKVRLGSQLFNIGK